MKHRKSIDLRSDRPVRTRYAQFELHKALKDLSSWEMLGAECDVCQRQSWFDSGAIMRWVGADMTLFALQPRLKCQCGNRDGNKLMIGLMRRD
ncbi:hypothetical protein C8J36_101119 [Rhizobium sp. PP-F2F-G48]|nr:hypothetical protein C8J36_101119 [Rhizobium sp. PP-F2F-G48]